MCGCVYTRVRERDSYCGLEDLQLVLHQIYEDLVLVDLGLADLLYSAVDAGLDEIKWIEVP